MPCHNASVASVLLIAVTLTASSRAQNERIDVPRLLIDVRVADSAGRAVPHLGAGDFAVTIDGRLAPIDRVEWVGTESVRTNDPALSFAPRLVVFFVQRTLDANVARRERDVIALAAALRRLTNPVLAELGAPDRVAVLSFDMHLKIWSDFTDDLDHVRRILQHDLLTRHSGAVAQSRDISLLTEAFRARADTTYRMAAALTRLGEALQRLPGSKTVVLLGQGFGQPDAFYRSLVETAVLPALLDEEYRNATRSLLRSRAAIVAVDVTAADRHTLETGIERLANETGGFYTKTYPFDKRAIDQVVQALNGHYTLSVERPPGQAGVSRRIQVSLPGRSDRVRAPAMYVE